MSRFVKCIDVSESRHSFININLTLNKIYEVIEETLPAHVDSIIVVDDSGKKFGYVSKRFIFIDKNGNECNEYEDNNIFKEFDT